MMEKETLAWASSRPTIDDSNISRVQMTLDAIRDTLARGGSPIGDNPASGHNLVPAGVLLLLYEKDGETCVLLNKRTNLVEHHKGEISFPGGAWDRGDATILDTALRETHEEMGIRREDVEILCRLSQVTTRSLFSITPFVGIVPSAYPFHVNDCEVAEILEVPLPVLLSPANWREPARADGNALPVERAYACGEHLVFGATARILTQFLGLVAPALRAGVQ